MDPVTEADRMKQWALDGLSGYVGPLESTVKKLMDENADLRAENGRLKAVAEAAEKHIGAGGYVLPELINALAALEVPHG